MLSTGLIWANLTNLLFTRFQHQEEGMSLLSPRLRRFQYQEGVICQKEDSSPLLRPRLSRFCQQEEGTSLVHPFSSRLYQEEGRIPHPPRFHTPLLHLLFIDITKSPSHCRPSPSHSLVVSRPLPSLTSWLVVSRWVYYPPLRRSPQTLHSPDFNKAPLIQPLHLNFDISSRLLWPRSPRFRHKKEDTPLHPHSP